MQGSSRWGEGGTFHLDNSRFLPSTRGGPTPNHLCATFFQLVFIDGQPGSRQRPCRDHSRCTPARCPAPALTRQRRGYGQGRVAASENASPASPTSRGDEPTTITKLFPKWLPGPQGPGGGRAGGGGATTGWARPLPLRPASHTPTSKGARACARPCFGGGHRTGARGSLCKRWAAPTAVIPAPPPAPAPLSATPDWPALPSAKPLAFPRAAREAGAGRIQLPLKAPAGTPAWELESVNVGGYICTSSSPPILSSPPHTSLVSQMFRQLPELANQLRKSVFSDPCTPFAPPPRARVVKTPAFGVP